MEGIEKSKMEMKDVNWLDILQEEINLFLDDLREIGITNMFGAVPYIQLEYPELTEQQAKQALLNWMNTFKERHSK